MSMEKEIGSIMKYVYDMYPHHVYTEKVPQDFEVPSLYFPPPISFSTPFTSHSFEKDYTLNIKLFNESEQTAFAKAEAIADSIRKGRYCVPIVNEDGTPAKLVLIMNEIDTRMADSGLVVMGVAQLTLNWKSRYAFEFPTYQKMMKIYGRFVNQ